jgi:uncharacterized protein (TIGR02271 family)
MRSTNDIREGMTVYSADGHKLGKVVRSDASGIIIEKGIFFIKDYLARHEDVAQIVEDEVRLAVNRADLRELGEDEALGAAGGRAVGATDAPDAGVTPRDTPATAGELRVPVVEEQLSAEKRMRDAGEVVIHKEVHTEKRQIEVPVVREEVHVERRAVNQPAGGAVADLADETIRVPVREEEIAVTKRPVIREEVRVTRTPHVEQRTAEGTVRREEVDVDDTTTRKRGPGNDGGYET